MASITAAQQQLKDACIRTGQEVKRVLALGDAPHDIMVAAIRDFFVSYYLDPIYPLAKLQLIESLLASLSSLCCRWWQRWICALGYRYAIERTTPGT
jgi:hypothetical protein